MGQYRQHPQHLWAQRRAEEGGRQGERQGGRLWIHLTASFLCRVRESRDDDGARTYVVQADTLPNGGESYHDFREARYMAEAMVEMAWRRETSPSPGPNEG